MTSLHQQTRRHFVSMTSTGVLGILAGCGGEDKDSSSSTGTQTSSDTGSDTDPAHDTSGATDTAPAPDTGSPVDTDRPVDTDDPPARECQPTVESSEGPYWIEGVPVRTEFDLYGHEGTPLTVAGRVLDLDCTPIAGAVVEIWHARPTTITIDQLNESNVVEYDNGSEEMEYRGQMATDALGRYRFHTLKPGWYMNGGPYAGTYRPSHIHIKIWIGGIERLTTQLYFEGDPLIEEDPWVKPNLELQVTEDEEGALSTLFDFVIDTAA